MTPPERDDIADPGPRRRYSARPFPAYRFVPGARPHPTRDAAGHSFAAPSIERGEDDWLYGVDLFNAHYFWEAHEAWESLWMAYPRESSTALFFQGLIQIAAALLKTHMQSAAGARKLSAEGLDKLRRVAAQSPSMMGLDLPRTIIELERYFAASPSDVAAAPVLRLENCRG